MGATLSRHGQADEAETAVVKAPSRKNPFKACFTASQAHYGACLSKSGAFLKALRHEDDDRQEQKEEDPKKAVQLACKGAACCATAAARVPVPPAEDEEHVDCAQAQAVTNPDTALILNMLDPENGPAAGLPYQVHWLGPPRPPCEKERLATVLALNKIREDAPADPEISTILKLVASVFKAPAALCALFDEKRVFISEQEGNVIPCGDFPWRWTLCGWSMAFKNPQILVIQDTLEDARFHNNNKVQAFPFVRFYCGAPLIAGNGHRLGTLCFADVKPRKFDMASCVMMNNLSELVVRQLEKDIALKLKERDNKQLRDTYKHLQRAMDCYEHTVVLLDIEADGWKVVYANAAWTKQTGLPREALLDHSLREVLELTDGTQLPSKALVEAAKKQKCVTLPMARLCDPAVTKTFTVSFKPAGRQALDESTMPIGVPTFLSLEGGDDDVSHRFFFMTLYPPGHKPSTVASPLMPSGWNLLNTGASDASSDRETVVSGLEVAHLLGRGSFGWVYYGTWFGTPVAVKVIDNDVRKPTTSGCGATAGLSETRFSGSHTPGSCGAPHQEALLAHELKHPYIVATLKYATRMVPMNRVPDLAEYGCGSTPTVGSIMAASDMLSGSKPSSANTPLPDTSLLGTATSETGAAAAAVAAEGTPSEAAPFRAWAVIEANAGPEEDSEHLEEEHMSSATDAELIRACQVRAEAWGMDERAGSTHVSRGAAGTAIDSGTHSGTANHSTASTWLQQTWMVMEYCDKGCVQDAVDRGWLRTARDCLQSEANMPAVVATAFEIASAMHYLHDNDIVHGDLTGWNVMLSSSGSTASLAGRGFVAKVADFGMSRNMEMRSRITTRNYGTITHMPPELLTVGTSSHAVDVYSFGVLLWQMYTGSRPWSGLTHAQIIVKVVQQRQQLQWDDHVPAEYRQLAEECMSYEREARPTFDKIVARLEAMKEELGLS